MVIVQTVKNFIAWYDSQIPTDEFLHKYSNELSKIKIGTSFKLEHFSDEEIETGLALACLKSAVEDLGIKDIRLGIRWNKVQFKSVIDLSYYAQIWNYCFSKDISICLNVGPIKVMGWPEEHPLLGSLHFKQLPDRNALIKLDSEFAQSSLIYLESLLELLNKTFTQKQKSLIKYIQADNEAYYPFGLFGWTMDSKYEDEVIGLIRKYFPAQKLYFTSAGRRNLRTILDQIERLESQGILTGKESCIGYNYYYKTPGNIPLPILNKLDNITLTKAGAINLNDYKQITEEKGIEIEVSEAQCEPWTYITSPGNNFREFKFMLLRCMRELLNLQQDKSLIRFWGIEEFTKKIINKTISGEHEEIREIIQTINM